MSTVKSDIEMVYLVNLMGTETGLKQPKLPIVEALKRHIMFEIYHNTLYFYGADLTLVIF